MPAPIVVDPAALLRAAPRGSGRLVLAHAPGRVNLIGEHTDYNGLPVLPMAIDRGVYVAARATDDGRVQVRNLDPAFAAADFAWSSTIEPSPDGTWTNYVKAAMQMVATVVGPSRHGAALTVASDLPTAAGLSSSSALLVATALGALGAHDVTVDTIPLAESLAVAERYVGTLSGGMDQAAILCAEAGAALRIDFFPLRTRAVPLPSECAVVIADSLVRAEKSAGARTAYNRRVVECRLAGRLLAHATGLPLVRLGDLTRLAPGRALTGHVDTLAATVPDRALALAEIATAAGTTVDLLLGLLVDDTGRPLDLDGVDGFRPLARARHVFTEAGRVDGAEAAFLSRHPERVGALMSASHRSCRDDYEISVPALDTLARIAEDAGAYGARMTGAGFGGSVVCLVPAPRCQDVLAALDAGFYRSRLAGRDPERHRFVVEPAAGARVTPADAP